MSDGVHQGREWLFYIRDMIEFGERALSYTAGLDQAAFVADARTYDATLRNLELIGESATHVPEAARERHPGIHWGDIIGARNQLAHGYLGMNDDLIWDMIEVGVPDLLPKLRSLLDAEEGGAA